MGIARKGHRGTSGVSVGHKVKPRPGSLTDLARGLIISVERLIRGAILTGTLRRFTACFGDGRILEAERTADNNGYLDRRPDGRPVRRLDRERNGWPNH